MRKTSRRSVTIDDGTWERLEQYAWENHLVSVSAAIRELTWKAKVKNAEVKGQQKLDFEKTNS